MASLCSSFAASTVSWGRWLPERRWLSHLIPGERLNPPLVLPFVVPYVFHRRQDLLGKELRVLHRQLFRHVAELQQGHQVADAQAVRELADLLGTRP